MSTCPWHNAAQTDEEVKCLICPLRDLSLCADLSKEDLFQINQNKRTLQYAKNEYIFKQGVRPSGIYILAKGKVKNVRISESGYEQIIGLQKPVDFLGFNDFISDLNHTFSAVALEDCSVSYIPTQDFQAILHRNNAFANKTLRYIGQLFSANVERTSNLTGKHLRGRMADTLLYIYDLFEVSKSNEVLDIELRRRDLAGMANMNTANAIRTLSEFSKANWIHLDKSKITYKDIHAIRRTSMTS